MKNIVICSAVRTPIGTYGGAFKNFTAVDLGIVAAKEAMKRAHVKPEQIDEVYVGNILGAGLGQNISRQISIGAGVPVEVPALTVNILCASGMKAVILGIQSMQTGCADICLCGGTENMSWCPYLVLDARWGARMGPSKMMDYVSEDGLHDIFNHYHMGVTAENVADRYHITREEMDEFSVRSQNRAEAAQKEHKFDPEIVPVVIHTRKGDVTVSQDEGPKWGCTLEGISKLKPCFKKDGRVTPASSSGINDGAAMLVIATEEKAKELGLPVLATIVSHATAGVDPAVMGLGPIPASRMALKKAGWTIKDVDFIEANEAFAAQSIAVVRDLQLPIEKTNIFGGAIALGHPIGCSGARIMVTLLNVMQQNHAHKGLATLCVGGGMGCAVCLEMK